MDACIEVCKHFYRKRSQNRDRKDCFWNYSGNHHLSIHDIWPSRSKQSCHVNFLFFSCKSLHSWLHHAAQFPLVSRHCWQAVRRYAEWCWSQRSNMFTLVWLTTSVLLTKIWQKDRVSTSSHSTEMMTKYPEPSSTDDIIWPLRSNDWAAVPTHTPTSQSRARISCQSISHDTFFLKPHVI